MYYILPLPLFWLCKTLLDPAAHQDPMVGWCATIRRVRSRWYTLNVKEIRREALSGKNFHR